MCFPSANLSRVCKDSIMLRTSDWNSGNCMSEILSVCRSSEIMVFDSAKSIIIFSIISETRKTGSGTQPDIPFCRAALFYYCVASHDLYIKDKRIKEKFNANSIFLVKNEIAHLAGI